MKRFIVRCFAVIGFVVVLLIGLGVAAQHYQNGKPPKEPDNVILSLDFDAALDEQASPSPLAMALHEPSPITLFDILRALDLAKDDPHVKGVVAKFSTTQPSFVHVEEINDAIKRFRASGKFTYAYGHSFGEFGMGNRAYVLASAFENLWLQQTGTVSLTGLAMYAPFGKAALDKIGISPDFMQREEYKSFMDMATRDDYAVPVRENMQSLVDNLADQEIAILADNRHWDAAHVKDLMAKGPYTDDEAVSAGLITKLGYADELEDELKKKTSDKVEFVNPIAYNAYAHEDDKAESKATVAMIFGTGMILDHEVGGVNQVTGEQIMAADKIADAFDAAVHDKEVKAILFRIDSPGGTPSASETIRHAIVHAQKAGKPVFVSMGEVAASGGYWIAMNADHIIAEPGTLTGSIGIITGKFSARELMQKLGVNLDAVRTSENAGMWLPTDRFTDMQRERVTALIDNGYREFTANVAAARKIPVEKIPDFAKGRVFTGEQASKNGLVDELGGYWTSFTALRKKLGLAEKDTITLQIYPRPETAVERLTRLLRSFGFDMAMMGSTWQGLQQIQGTLAPLLNNLSLNRAPMLAHMPTVEE